ncbi:MAG: hypothetical protein U0904_10550 [Candidatus Nanopelagicales bacterium]|nr:hypothetical protein [Candidatus Nanopelagicales bacterium]
MTRPLAGIVGLGASGPVAQDPRSIPEMVLTAVEDAIGDAGIGFADIDAVVSASVDLYDGLTASNIAITEVVGAVMKPETRIAGDGLAALAHAACLVWAGAYDTVLVVAHGKASMAPQDLLSEWVMDPVLLQPLGASFMVCSGLQAQLLATEGAERRWARRAAELRGCDITDVLDSPISAAPLRALMKAPDADAAFAVVLRANQPGVTVESVGFDLDTHAPGDRDLRSWAGLRRAFKRAGGHGTGAFDVVADSCRFPHEEELFQSAVGLAPTGGLFAGAAPVAAGLGQLVAATRALRTVPGRALAHGTWGPAGQAHAVAVLERVA